MLNRLSLVKNLFSSDNNATDENEFCSQRIEEPRQKSTKIRHMIFLSVAYAANCGGTGTLTGTGSNLILKGTLSEFGVSPINFATW